MTRRDKLRTTLTDDQLWDYICMHIDECCECPLLEICQNELFERKEQFEAWLDEEVEE